MSPSVLSKLSQPSPYKPSTSSRLVLLGLVNRLIPIMKLSLLILSCGGAAALNVRYSCPSGSKAPHISLDYGTFRGTSNFTGVNSFLGLPFAKAGRYENPRVLDARDHLKGVRDATKYGPECPQQLLTPLLDEIHSEQVLEILSGAAALLSRGPVTEDEDCLSINVQVPAGSKSAVGLPVLLWIHGGGFGTGASAIGTETTPLSASPHSNRSSHICCSLTYQLFQDMIYQGARIVERPVQMGQPFSFRQTTDSARLQAWLLRRSWMQV